MPDEGQGNLNMSEIMNTTRRVGWRRKYFSGGFSKTVSQQRRGVLYLLQIHEKIASQYV